MKYEYLNFTFLSLQILKVQNKILQSLVFHETKAGTRTCLIYVNIVTKPFCWSKDETTYTSSMLYTRPLGKIRSNCSGLKILKLYFQWQKLVCKNSESPSGIRHKECWWPKRAPYQCGPREDRLDNFKNFFQMTMLFVAYVGLS